MSCTVKGEGRSEYVEKKSRFLGVLYPATTEEEAQDFIKAVKKEHYSARHNCYAYIIEGDSESGSGHIARSSDDGEPGGTAGRPILEAMEYKGVTNGVLVVTRYFGGVLLGTGGLTRAYGQAAKEAIEDASLLERIYGHRITIRTDYTGYGKVEYILRQGNYPIVDTQYDDGVTVDCVCPEADAKALADRIVDDTSGTADVSVSDPLYYGLTENKVEFL